MIDCCIGETEEDFFAHRFRQFVMVKQIRKQAVGIVPADGAQNHVGFRIAESGQQILRPLFRMIEHIVQPHSRVRHEFHIQSVFLQSANADIHFELHRGFADDSAGKADNCDIPDPRCRYGRFAALRRMNHIQQLLLPGPCSGRSAAGQGLMQLS